MEVTLAFDAAGVADAAGLAEIAAGAVFGGGVARCVVERITVN